MEPQADVLFHVIAQPNSRDAVHSMLGISRQVRPASVLGGPTGNYSHWVGPLEISLTGWAHWKFSHY